MNIGSKIMIMFRDRWDPEGDRSIIFNLESKEGLQVVPEEQTRITIPTSVFKLFTLMLNNTLCISYMYMVINSHLIEYTTYTGCKVVFMGVFLGKGVQGCHQILKRVRDSLKLKNHCYRL